MRYILSLTTLLLVLGMTSAALAASGCNNGSAKDAVVHSKKDPAAASANVGDLMGCAQQELSDSPQTTAQDLAAVSGVAGILSGDAAKQVGASLQSLIDALLASNLPSADPKTAATIFAEALAIAGNSNITAYDPKLYATIAGQEPDGVKEASGNGNGGDGLLLAQKPSLVPPSIPSFQYRSSAE